jgi:hypothetical protein
MADMGTETSPYLGIPRRNFCKIRRAQVQIVEEMMTAAVMSHWKVTRPICYLGGKIRMIGLVAAMKLLLD